MRNPKPSNESNQAASPNILHIWGQLGRDWHAQASPTSWPASQSLIHAAKEFEKTLREEYEEVLNETAKRFSPLDEPLRTDFKSNGWFSGIREENYSDWLAWTIQQLAEPHLIFEVLQITEHPPIPLLQPLTNNVKREEFVLEGHEGQTGRLDILILLNKNAIINIEVKVEDADDTDHIKNAGYAQSLRKKFAGKNILIFLVTDAAQNSYHGYRVLKWEHLCLGLRKIVARRPPTTSITTRGLILAFVGAVEQNLLGFPSGTKHLAGDQLRVLSYLRQSLE